MKCPKCGKEIANDSTFCEFCGEKVNQLKSSAVNQQHWYNHIAWMICAVVFFFASILLLVIAIDCNNSYENMFHSLCETSDELYNVRAQLPQTYITKYPNQYYYYNCTGDYIKADCYINEAGSVVLIYTQEDGYGLTNWGWIPMDCLEEQPVAVE